jgi:succinoglycan biosynthesis protein ExoL
MRIAYFVHDLADPAVAKRVRMLRAGGAEVVVTGFHRGEVAPALDGARAIDLGRTHDGRFAQRVAKVLGSAFRAGTLRQAVADADVIMARNLEMLLLANVARGLFRREAGLVYECLDVHRLMLSDRWPGRLLRGLERLLMRGAGLLIVSSPAFVRSYFEPRQRLGAGPWRLVENKVFDPRPTSAAHTRPAPGRPWKIGWFGAIRCQRGLDILSDLAARRPDLVEIDIRGRPSRIEFRDFDAQVRATPALRFHGAYRPDDVPALYGAVHFTWAFDYFEEGANSAWLLPNRIYEGGRHGAVPLAAADVETGAWLAANGLGVLMDDPARQLEAALEAMTPARYAQLAAEAAAARPELFSADVEDCRALVRALGAARPAHARQAVPDAAEALA